jgi:hypothetical protein
MVKHVNVKPGDFVAIPLPDGGYGYCRILMKLVAFYDIHTKELVKIDQFANCSVLFICSVRKKAPAIDHWIVSGNRPLEPELNREVKFFKIDLVTSDFSIYVSIPAPPNAYKEYAVSKEECQNLEPLMSWEPNHIEVRLSDHFHNRENWIIKRYVTDVFGSRES